jgi:serine/threonine protein phosphatase 1
VEKYWKPETEILIQLDDLINRGNFIPETVGFARKLADTYPLKTVFLRGNHEFKIMEHHYNGPNNIWTGQVGEKTMQQYKNSDVDLISDIKWFSMQPISWENDRNLINHAGISEEASNPYANKVQ